MEEHKYEGIDGRVRVDQDETEDDDGIKVLVLPSRAKVIPYPHDMVW